MFVLIKSPETGAVYTTDLWDKIDFTKSNKIRAFVTLMLFFLRKWILKQEISETQLGCKLYKRDIIKKCAARVNVNNFLYEIYLTDLIFLEGCTIEECSVKIDKFSEKSTVKLKSIFDSLITFMKYAIYERKKLGIFPKRKRRRKVMSKFMKAFIASCFILAAIVLIPFFQDIVNAANSNFIINIIESDDSKVVKDKYNENSIELYNNKKTHPSKK